MSLCLNVFYAATQKKVGMEQRQELLSELRYPFLYSLYIPTYETHIYFITRAGFCLQQLNVFCAILYL